MQERAKRSNGLAIRITAILYLFLLCPTMVWAGDVTLAWDANSESNVAGYKLYYDGDSDSEMYQGTGANEGASPVIIYLEDLADTDAPEFTLTGLTDGQYYYFSLTAFDTDGLESAFSDEVGTTIGESIDASGGTTDSSGGSTDSSTSSSNDGGGSSSGACFITGIMADGTPCLPFSGIGMILLIIAVFWPGRARHRSVSHRRSAERRPRIISY